MSLEPRFHRLAHSSGVVVIEMRAEGGDWQGGSDESWAIDNLRVLVDACYADCDDSGALDFFDFLCFQNAFTAADPAADCDGDGELTFFDFLCFQNAFSAGCP